MINLEATIKNATAVKRQVKRKLDVVQKAEDTAVRVEAYRLMKLLRKEIRAGAPGGRRLAPLSIIRRTQGAYKRGGLRTDRPLIAMARAVGYETIKRSPVELKFGFVGPASSTTWRRLVKMHAEGFTKSPDDPVASASGRTLYGGTIRESLAFWGSQLGSQFARSRSRRRNVFFLRRATHQLRTPARPIMEPFWAAHRAEALRNIRANFKRKLAGERI